MAKGLIMLTATAMLETVVLLSMGQYCGYWPTFLTVMVTSVIGIVLAHRQGVEVFRKLQEELTAGYFPGDEILDGMIVLAGAFFLVTPGLVTDLLGFLCLTPRLRILILQWVKGRFVVLTRGDNIRYFH